MFSKEFLELDYQTLISTIALELEFVCTVGLILDFITCSFTQVGEKAEQVMAIINNLKTCSDKIISSSGVLFQPKCVCQVSNLRTFYRLFSIFLK